MKMTIEKLKQSTKNVTDPRRTLFGNIRHNLESILVIGLLSTLCGGTDFPDMEMFGKAKHEWLRKFLELPRGIPDSDTFRRVFERMNPNELATCLNEWVVEERQSPKSVSIDGKTICGSGNTAHSAYHVVSAWANEHGITLGQVAVDEKSNEITAIPQLLEAIDIQGAVVTIDAMGCQRAIAAMIIAKNADYVLALKKNHKNLYNQVTACFDKIGHETCSDEWIDSASNGSRVEKRITTVISAKGVANAEDWANLVSLVRCRYIVIENGQESIDDRFFLCSLPPNARRIGRIIRGHWSIENQLHWMLDVVFDEDAASARKDNSPLNMNILRKTALKLLYDIKPYFKRVSYKKLIFRAALETDFLETILGWQ
jgi:predicted transposase YbfD/YdcC